MPFPVAEEYIIAAENELQLIFPQAFKNKMIEENGGELFIADDYWQIFPFFDESTPKRKIRTCNHIVRETKLARTWDGFPDSAIAFAQNDCGDYLIFLPEPFNSNVLSESVYVWFHETHQVEQITNPLF
ncbi:SMI1/KNR4 family protein [Acinetobacter sp. A47]|uniref:SMI1/KNR4 family protein n=1 Tax=Acinetobacter sp. A47 TaxID=1561217 RepID=UPI00056E48C6|nr:SMI1/KNR4 family protein [Acinetobacter sp. A47]